MTERGLPSADGAPACPFVAFGDDREGRSTSPDHRHRCFAETPPAPRAVAHQEAYCLSSAFPVCPTFQDWAKREAAHARGAGLAAESAPVAVAIDQPVDRADEDPGPTELDEVWPDDSADDSGDDAGDEPAVQRNPPRDWAAPPPWATGQSGAAGASVVSRIPPPSPDLPKEGQGLAGSAADRLAAGLPVAEVGAVVATSQSAPAGPAAAPDPELAGLARSRAPTRPSPPAAPASRPQPMTSARPAAPGGKRPSVSSSRSTAPVIAGPSWEHMRHYEAYPTIKTRTGLPGIPRIAFLAGAVAIAALTLFMLPALLGVGGGGGSSGASASPSVPVATDSPTPEIPAEPTPTVYVVKAGDSLGKIANKFGLTIDQVMAANPEIKNPNKISVGQEIVIPVPETSAS
jgi:LysM domain